MINFIKFTGVYNQEWLKAQAAKAITLDLKVLKVSKKFNML